MGYGLAAGKGEKACVYVFNTKIAPGAMLKSGEDLIDFLYLRDQLLQG
jgi:hypothetical protein